MNGVRFREKSSQKYKGIGKSSLIDDLQMYKKTLSYKISKLIMFAKIDKKYNSVGYQFVSIVWQLWRRNTSADYYTLENG